MYFIIYFEENSKKLKILLKREWLCKKDPKIR